MRSTFFKAAVVVLLFLPAAACAESKEPLTLSVKQALALALANSPKMEAALASITAAEEEAQELAAPGRTQATLIGDSSLVLPPPGAPQQANFGGTVANFQSQSADPFARIGGALRVRQLIFDGGLLSAQLESAAARTDGSKLEAVSEWRDLALDVQIGYLNVLRSRKKLEIAKESLATAQYHVEVAQARFLSGQVAQADVVYAELPLAQAEVSVLRAEQQLTTARESLNVLLGLEPRAKVTLEDPKWEEPDPISDDQAVQRALRELPQLRVARAEIQASESAAEAAGKVNNPLLFFGAQYQPVAYQGFISSGYEVGFRLEWKFLDGAEGRHAMESAKAELKAGQARLRQAERESEQRVLSALRGVELAKLNEKAALVQVKRASEALRVAMAQYEFGFAEFLVVRDAQRELVAAQVAQADAGYGRLEAQARLNWALGEAPAVALELPEEGQSEDSPNR